MLGYTPSKGTFIMQRSRFLTDIAIIELVHRKTGEPLRLTPDTQWKTLVGVPLTNYSPQLATLMDGRPVEIEYDGHNVQGRLDVRFYAAVKNTHLKATLILEKRPIHSGMNLTLLIF